ncbi:hypothetical protein D3C75_573860 [compost metagenome]
MLPQSLLPDNGSPGSIDEQCAIPDQGQLRIAQHPSARLCKGIMQGDDIALAEQLLQAAQLHLQRLGLFGGAMGRVHQNSAAERGKQTDHLPGNLPQADEANCSSIKAGWFGILYFAPLAQAGFLHILDNPPCACQHKHKRTFCRRPGKGGIGVHHSDPSLKNNRVHVRNNGSRRMGIQLQAIRFLQHLSGQLGRAPAGNHDILSAHTGCEAVDVIQKFHLTQCLKPFQHLRGKEKLEHRLIRNRNKCFHPLLPFSRWPVLRTSLRIYAHLGNAVPLV